ncbi:MAG: hypothetical protein M3N13_05650, partial [Candidatus Eremiobacteraeota bacterium]|nr:hypothetical protein [Candidatus Eremiobacteraeota bacterium]
MKNERRIMRGVHAVLPGGGFNPDDLTPPEQAVIAFLARAQIGAPAQETVALESSDGRFLAIDIRADRDYPRAARSTMDGFAVRSADTPGKLRIIGDVKMGELFTAMVGSGEAARIPTGGFLPSGADTVVPVEQATVSGAAVSFENAAPSDDCLAQRGEDMKQGETILEHGRRIGPSEISVLATLGIA